MCAYMHARINLDGHICGIQHTTNVTKHQKQLIQPDETNSIRITLMSLIFNNQG